jgi:hypothetical protein
MYNMSDETVYISANDECEFYDENDYYDETDWMKDYQYSEEMWDKEDDGECCFRGINCLEDGIHKLADGVYYCENCVHERPFVECGNWIDGQYCDNLVQQWDDVCSHCRYCEVHG